MTRHRLLAVRVSLASSFLLLAACSGTSPTASDHASAADTESALASSALRAHDVDRVFVLGNDASNEVIVFDAPDDGTLREIDRVATGGRGSGDALGSQGALAVSGEHAYFAGNTLGSTGEGNGYVGRIARATGELNVLMTKQVSPTSIAIDGASVYWDSNDAIVKTRL